MLQKRVRSLCGDEFFLKECGGATVLSNEIVIKV